MRAVSKKSQKLNDYLAENPDVKASMVAKLFKATVQSIYQRRAKLKLAAGKSAKRGRPRQIPSTLVPNAVMSMAVYADDMVNHPPHYKTGGIETIDFIEAKNLGYNLGNVVKYISRADYKGDRLENLKKAQWYMNREVALASKK